MEKEREGFSRPSPTRSPGAPLIDSLLFLRSSFIYTQLYLFRLTSALRGSQPITYALLTRTPSTSHGSHLHLHLPSSSPFSPSLPLLFPPLISNPFHPPHPSSLVIFSHTPSLPPSLITFPRSSPSTLLTFLFFFPV